ncbi:DUF1467 domain-containing protein [Natrarchaeobius chitinivorans]|uniref:DUF1467 domain-containing protein n=1 Tax=Natrarchaeobius chitinivorans TaxID=1679083 RepID=A0A3N6M3L1_NATCH|nr:DUF1467 domain-containing protein [Natrarchaeobius chitinivorans]RQG98063.1 DUF1467 domain-containing protein [Natrarchaeobius chitinivorans]
MRQIAPASSTLFPAVSTGFVALGVAVNDGFAPSVRTIPALLLIAVGLVGVTSSVSDRPVDSLRVLAGRWWALAFVAFLPYALATAPASDRAVEAADAISGPVATTALEAVAGAAVLAAVSVTVLYWFAEYGIHPGRPAPEDRILEDRRKK